MSLLPEHSQKIPGAKTKCTQCGQFMYVRTRPEDGARTVVTEAEAHRIEESWKIKVMGGAREPDDHAAMIARTEKRHCHLDGLVVDGQMRDRSNSLTRGVEYSIQANGTLRRNCTSRSRSAVYHNACPRPVRT